MKKIIMGTIASMLCAGVMMADQGWGIEVGAKTASTGDKNLLGIQPISELIGDGGEEVFIEPFLRGDDTHVGIRISNNSTLDENKLELTWKHGVYKNEVFGWYFNGGAGFGVQGGQTKTISTNITAPDYITSTSLGGFKVPTKAKIDDSNYFTLSIGTGIDFKITKNLKANIGYEYEAKYWDISYVVEGKETTPVDLSGEAIGSHGIRAGLEFRF